MATRWWLQHNSLINFEAKVLPKALDESRIARVFDERLFSDDQLQVRRKIFPSEDVDDDDEHGVFRRGWYVVGDHLCNVLNKMLDKMLIEKSLQQNIPFFQAYL